MENTETAMTHVPPEDQTNPVVEQENEYQENLRLLNKPTVITSRVSRGFGVKNWARIIARSGAVPVKIENPEKYLPRHGRKAS